jgi:DNA replication protein DnaC
MNREELIDNLRCLRLPTMAVDYLETARQCEKTKSTHEQYLACLVKAEVEKKRLVRIQRRVKEAQIKRLKRLETYDFSCRKGITAEQVTRLSACDFVRKTANVVLYGPVGVGKSHLATGLAIAACEAGFRCLWRSTQELVNELVAAHRTLSLSPLMKRLDGYDLVCCDELGYTPQTAEGADLFFQFISQRYERRSLVITTNLTYSEWDKVFLSPMSTAAAVDRIIHNCETYNITGPSWRAEEAKKRTKESAK